MSQPLISVCVRTQPHYNLQQVASLVVGRHGELRPNVEPGRFWARTALTLRQVRAIEGVKDCRLHPVTW